MITACIEDWLDQLQGCPPALLKLLTDLLVITDENDRVIYLYRPGGTDIPQLAPSHGTHYPSFLANLLGPGQYDSANEWIHNRESKDLETIVLLAEGPEKIAIRLFGIHLGNRNRGWLWKNFSANFTPFSEANEKNRYFEDILNALPLNVYVKNPNGSFRFANKHTLDFLGLTWDEIKDKNDFDVFPADVAQNLVNTDRELKANPYQLLQREEEIRLNGKPTHYLLAGKKILDPLYPHDSYLIGYSIDITDRKNLELALRDQKDFIRSVIDANPNLIFVKDEHGNFLLVNDAVAKVFGKSISEIENLPNNVVHNVEDELEVFDRIDREVIKTGQPTELEETLTVDGEIHYYRTYKTPLLNLDGNIHVLGTSVDITRIKQYEQQLKDQRREYQSLVESLSEVVFKTDIEGRWLFLNPSWTTLTGFEIQESLGQNEMQYILPDDLDNFQEAFSELIAGVRSHIDCSLRYIRKDGTICWIRVNADPLFNKEGLITGTSGTLRDIHDLVTHQEKLEETRAFYEHILNMLPVEIAVYDTQGRYLFVNPQSMPNELQRKEVVGAEHMGLISHIQLNRPLEYSRQVENFRKSLHSRQPTSWETEITDKNGRKHHMLRGFYPIYKTNGDVHFIIGYGLDITTRKVAEEELRQALMKERELNELKSRFVNMASHEFRTPLAAIQTTLDLIELKLERTEVPDLDFYRENLLNISQEIFHISELINSLLTLGKIEAGTVKACFTPIRLLDLMQDVVNQYFCNRDDKREVVIHITGQPYRNMADMNLMRQVFRNLLSNAFKYDSAHNPYVHFLFHPTQTEIRVSDRGIGIAEEEINRLFSSFYRAPNALHIEGTGLGLLIVKQFVELHQGVVLVESELNQGSTFTIILPKTIINI